MMKNDFNARVARELVRIARMVAALGPDLSSLVNRVKSDPHDLIARNQLLSDEGCPATYLRQFADSRDLVAVRLVAANPSCPLDILNRLMNHPDKSVVKAATSNPRLHAQDERGLDAKAAMDFYREFQENGYASTIDYEAEETIDSINECLKLGLYDDPEVLRDLYSRSKFNKKAIIECARMHGINDDEVTTMNGGFRKIIADSRSWASANGASLSYNQSKYEIRISYAIDYKRSSFPAKELPDELPDALARKGGSDAAISEYVEKACRLSLRSAQHRCQILVELSDCRATATVDGREAIVVDYRKDADLYRDGGFDEVVIRSCQEAISATAAEVEKDQQSEAAFAQQEYREQLTRRLKELWNDAGALAFVRGRSRRIASMLVRLARALVAE